MPNSGQKRPPPPISHSSPLNLTVALAIGALSVVGAGVATYQDLTSKVARQGERIENLERENREERAHLNAQRTSILDELQALKLAVGRLETKLDSGSQDVRRSSFK